MKRIPIPSDFRELAPGRTTAELAKEYGCSNRTVCNWRRECGIPPPKRTGSHRDTDTPEQIQYCLHCPVEECYGYKCPILPKVRKRKEADA